MPITIGSDPEVFVQRDDKIISGIGLIGGSKDNPRLTESGAVQEDNVLAEFNIVPAQTADEFVDNIYSVMGELNEILSPATTVVKSSHEYSVDDLIDFGPEAMEFGCDPDVNCWDKEINEAPDSSSCLRTAGGHVHIGYDNPNPNTSFRIARMCDIFLGIPSLLLDDDDQRRSMYGKSGACRIKAYGVEYRTLSNFWLKKTEFMEWVFQQSKYCAEKHDQLDSILEYILSQEEVEEIINTNDKDRAAEVVDALNIEMPEVKHAN